MKRSTAVVCILLAICVAIHLMYLWRTGPFERTYDVIGHLQHITLVADTFAPPEARACWQCYHPPVYYYLAAVYLRALKAVGISNEAHQQKALQALSLAFFIGFLFTTTNILKEIFPGSLLQWASICFVFFWPATFIHASRIGNDVAFYFFHTLAVYWLVKWDPRQGHLPVYYASYFAGWTLLTKANGVVTLALVAGTIALRMYQCKGQINHVCRMLTYSTLILLSSVGAFLGVVALKGGVFTNSDELGQGLAVSNTLANYFYFDVRAYFLEPYVHPWFDQTGRQYFWNYILKSSLTGEFSIFTSITAAMVPVLAGLLLWVFQICLIGFIYCIVKGQHTVLVLQAVLFVSALAANRWLAPFSCSTDFRYILPVLVSFAAFYTYALQQVHARYRVGAVCVIYAVLSLFIILSVLCVLVLLASS
jgi:hypothetical protein